MKKIPLAFNPLIPINSPCYIAITIIISIQRYIYICKNTGGLCYPGTNGLLTSDFSSSTRRERKFLKVFRNHTMLTTPPTFGTSRDILDLNSSSLVGTRKTQLNYRELNFLPPWSNVNPQLHGRTSTSQHHGRTSNESFSKSSKFLAHLF